MADPAARIMGPVTPRSSMSSSEIMPTPLRAADPDAVGGQQVFVLVDVAGKDVDELANRSPPPARRFQGQPADAEVAGHHALAAEHLEDLEDLFALAEAVEEHRHRADVEGVRAQPHHVAIDARAVR